MHEPERVFEQPYRVRGSEVDAQSVVFNGWYLFYFDDAMVDFLKSRGLDYLQFMESGFDCQLVHADVSWKQPLRWLDTFVVRVSTARLGSTSFALDFQACRGDDLACATRITYVVIATDGSGKRPIPDSLKAALGSPRPLIPPAQEASP